MVYNIDDYQLSSYNYDLPEELIAQHPLENRTESRLLHLDRVSGAVEHLQFQNLINLLQPEDLLILNNTRVTAFHLDAKRETGGKASLLVVSPAKEKRSFLAMAKPAKKLREGSRIFLQNGLSATILQIVDDSHRIIQFEDTSNWEERLEEEKIVPLPHYIHQPLKNSNRYQTVYSEKGGSSAAPTAGLHFTKEYLDLLKEKGVDIGYVTLNVGIDTFRPIQVENLEDIVMHGETCSVSEELAEKINACRGRIIAVGTTTVRTLESFSISKKSIGWGEKSTQLFISPGYTFNIVDGIITNFHLPKTTMLCMISAFSSRHKVLSAYKFAVDGKYRFLSFGDSMIII